jgi:asparagine synthase (glutamine-hydrolysing)
MCGIMFSSGPDLSYEELNLLNHRGPDYQAIERRDGMSFGHVRLSIQDLSSRSNQPFCDDENILLFNGEIYNCDELVNRFGLDVDYSSDTAVLFEGLVKIGTDFLKYVNGMYAVLFYDGDSIVIARDPAGVKCLYFTVGYESLCISSEIKGLVNLKELSLRSDLEIIYKLFRFIPAPLTAYEGVNKLQAGELISFKRNENGIFSQVKREKIEYQGRRHRIRTAIRSQLISDVPVASLISGGVDSSLISTAVEGIKFYHAKNDSGYKSEVNNVLNNKFVRQNLNIINIDRLSLESHIISVIEEPVTANSIYFLRELMANINETVILAGQGGDELFFGYKRYRLALVHDILRFCGFSSLLKRLKMDGELSRLTNLFGFNKNIEKIALLLGADPKDVHRSVKFLSSLYPQFDLMDNLTLTEAIVKFDREYSLPDELLIYTDKISMLYSKEVRVPLLDLSIIRIEPCSFQGLINLFIPKFTLRLLAISRGVFPKWVKIGFDYDLGIPKSTFQNFVWKELKTKR